MIFKDSVEININEEKEKPPMETAMAIK